jgi:hypothetical protein
MHTCAHSISTIYPAMPFPHLFSPPTGTNPLRQVRLIYFSSFYLSPQFMVASTGSKILHSFLYREYINHIHHLPSFIDYYWYFTHSFYLFYTEEYNVLMLSTLIFTSVCPWPVTNIICAYVICCIQFSCDMDVTYTNSLQ